MSDTKTNYSRENQKRWLREDIKKHGVKASKWLGAANNDELPLEWRIKAAENALQNIEETITNLKDLQLVEASELGVY